jgi:hypothetical protein
MKTWRKSLLISLIFLGVGGIYLFTVFMHRRAPGIGHNNGAAQSANMDDVAMVRLMFPASYDDALKLVGSSVWMKNGYTMPYYPIVGGRVVFSKPAGVIASAQRLDIKRILRATPPAPVDDGISHGSRQVFAVFMMPNDSTFYATAIGTIDGSQEAYFGDVLFYYDDPRTIYDNWPKAVWAAIDAHQVKPGMSELETRMAVGQKMKADRSTEGNRTVTYDQAGKHWTVTFVNNRATEVTSE